jgi:hypothetical protein
MPARRLASAKQLRDDGSIVEIVVWELPEPIPPCGHCFKYRLYFGTPGVCRVRYDNERGKGDHRHFGVVESAYSFTTVDQLLLAFQRDVAQWGKE